MNLSREIGRDIAALETDVEALQRQIETLRRQHSAGDFAAMPRFAAPAARIADRLRGRLHEIELQTAARARA